MTCHYGGRRTWLLSRKWCRKASCISGSKIASVSVSKHTLLYGSQMLRFQKQTWQGIYIVERSIFDCNLLLRDYALHGTQEIKINMWVVWAKWLKPWFLFGQLPARRKAVSGLVLYLRTWLFLLHFLGLQGRGRVVNHAVMLHSLKKGSKQ